MIFFHEESIQINYLFQFQNENDENFDSAGFKKKIFSFQNCQRLHLLRMRINYESVWDRHKMMIWINKKMFYLICFWSWFKTKKIRMKKKSINFDRCCEPVVRRDMIYVSLFLFLLENNSLASQKLRKIEREIFFFNISKTFGRITGEKQRKSLTQICVYEISFW